MHIQIIYTHAYMHAVFMHADRPTGMQAGKQADRQIERQYAR